MALFHNLILGSEILALGITACVVTVFLSAFLTSAIRAFFHLNTRDIKVWDCSDIACIMEESAKEGWAHRSLVAFDIAVNVILLRGQQDETISTHAWRAAREGKLWGKVMCWWLNLFELNHGPQAACGDLERATARVAVLKKSLGL